jgi:starch-binding outer membrane protein, SusD/RagB family
MKTYKNIFLYAFTSVVVALSGCSKFLDYPVENQPQSGAVDYTNLDLMFQPVSGAYNAVTRGGYITWVTTFLKTSQSDDIYPNTGYSEVNDLIHNYKSGDAIRSFWAINDMWNGYYGAIINCNNALAELDKFAVNIPAGDAANTQLLNRYRAELRVLSGLGHYYISRSFGNVPILGPESINPSYLDTVKTTPVGDVRKYIINEMNASIPNLEDVRPNQATHVGGITKYTALMLKAKTAMDLAGNDNGSTYWDTVLDCTNQIISSNKFSLFSDYYQLFKKPGKLCDESILEFQYSDFGTATGDNATSGPSNPSWMAWANLFLFQGPENTYGAPISGPGWLVPSDEGYNFLTDRNDTLRRKTTFERCGIDGVAGTTAVTPAGDPVSGNVSGKKYFNGKYYLPKSQMTPDRADYGANNNIRVFRYADVLLMNAEAKIRKGQNGDEPLNIVRERVGLPDLTNATLQQILDERRAEFICECWGERFNDLVRFDQAATVLPGFVKGQSEFFPIPQAQIDINANLK